jgi:hypothetical protein
MKTLIATFSLGGALVLAGCGQQGAEDSRGTKSPGIVVHYKKNHANGLGHEWTLTGQGPMSQGVNTLTWRRQDKDNSSNPKPFTIVVDTTQGVTWDDSQSVNRFYGLKASPFNNTNQYRAIDSWPSNNEHVVTLQVSQPSTSYTNAQYFVLVSTSEADFKSKATTYDYYMMDSVLSW